VNTLIFGDKNTLEVLPYSVEFSDRLLVGETITSTTINIFVFSGTDPTPSDLLGTVIPPAINAAGDTITFTLKEGIAGVIYLVVISALISSGNLYIKVGHVAVVASDPFASNAFTP
jgi:hypothetical protein